MSRRNHAAPSRTLATKRSLQQLSDDLALSDEEEAEIYPVSTPSPAPPLRTVPGIGTLVQRSDRQHADKMAWLMTPPPPPPKRRNAPAERVCSPASATTPSALLWPPKVAAVETRPSPPTSEVDLRRMAKRCVQRLASSPPKSIVETPAAMPTQRPTGPETPAPIRVEVEPGLTAEVPYFAAHVARKFKLRAGGAHWILRFNRQGQLRTRQRHEEAST